MLSLADLDERFGDAHRDADGQAGKPHAHIAHAMLFHAFSLLDMFVDRPQQDLKPDNHRGFMTNLYTTAWYHRIEPQDLLVSYLQDWVLGKAHRGTVRS